MRILIADDQPKVRFALRVLLERQAESLIINEATDAVEVLVEAMKTCPDLVLLAWDLPGREELDLVPALRMTCPAADIIALSGRSEARRAALGAGVDAFVSKGDPPERLLAAIEGCQPKVHGNVQERDQQARWDSNSGVSTHSSA